MHDVNAEGAARDELELWSGSGYAHDSFDHVSLSRLANAHALRRATGSRVLTMITQCGTAFQQLGVCVQCDVDKSQRACHGETVEGMRQAYHASKGVLWSRSRKAASGDASQ